MAEGNWMTNRFEPTAEDWETYKRSETLSVAEVAEAMMMLLERLQAVAKDGDKEAQLNVFRQLKYHMFYLAVAETREKRTGEASSTPTSDDIEFLQSEGFQASLETSAEEFKKAYWRVAVKHVAHVKERYDQQERYDRAVARLAELT